MGVQRARAPRAGARSGHAGSGEDIAPAKRPRARSPRGEGERLRGEILDATEALLWRAGDESAVSIRQVAEAVGVTAPSIYRHFADRDDLIFAVCLRAFQGFDERLEEMAAAGGGTPLDALRRRGRAYVQWAVENPEQYRVLFMGGLRKSFTPETITDENMPGTRAFLHLVEGVQACIDAAELAPGDAFAIATALWSMVHGVASLTIVMDGFPPGGHDRLIDEVLAIAGRGLAP